MEGRSFIDTSVLVRLYDARDGRKRKQARECLKLMALGSLVVSTQVLLEIYKVATMNLHPPLGPTKAAQVVASLAMNPVVVVDPALILVAIRRSTTDEVSFWDALVVESALAGGCDRLLTEDLQHGRRFGDLVVENPFVGLD